MSIPQNMELLRSLGVPESALNASHCAFVDQTGCLHGLRVSCPAAQSATTHLGR